MSKEYDEFNCSQDHEYRYVSSLYNNKSNKTVREFLEEKCESDEIYNSTHAEVYALLEANGFTRK